MGRVLWGCVIGKVLYSPAILECPALSLNSLFDPNRDLCRFQGWVVRDVQIVAKQHLQRVFTGLERDLSGSAAVTEMNMLAQSVQ